MTSERAKFLLSVYRPNGADAQDPAFKEALDQVRRDAALASWFQQQRDFDEMIYSKLRSIETPAALRETILAGLRTTAIPQYRIVRWLAIAAALALGLLFSGRWNWAVLGNRIGSWRSTGMPWRTLSLFPASS